MTRLKRYPIRLSGLIYLGGNFLLLQTLADIYFDGFPVGKMTHRNAGLALPCDVLQMQTACFKAFPIDTQIDFIN